jgi:hypothetical protein
VTARLPGRNASDEVRGRRALRRLWADAPDAKRAASLKRMDRRCQAGNPSHGPNMNSKKLSNADRGSGTGWHTRVTP